MGGDCSACEFRSRESDQTVFHRLCDIVPQTTTVTCISFDYLRTVSRKLTEVMFVVVGGFQGTFP